MSVDKLVDSTQLDSDLTSVADAIRTKGGTSAQLAFPNGFVSAIDAIPTGGTLITKTITENGTYSAEDDDADGYSEVTVNVTDPWRSTYQEVEYIGNTGSGKVVTNISYEVGLSIECEMSVQSIPTSQTGMFFSFSDNGSFWLGVSTSGVATIGGGNDFNSIVISDRNALSATYNANRNINATFNGVTRQRTGTSSTNVGDFTFFGVPLGVGYTLKSRLYGHAKVYKNTSLIREFVPCYRITDNQIGLFDIIQYVFYPITSDGEKGADVLSDSEALSILLGGE